MGNRGEKWRQVRNHATKALRASRDKCETSGGKWEGKESRVVRETTSTGRQVRTTALRASRAYWRSSIQRLSFQGYRLQGSSVVAKFHIFRTFQPFQGLRVPALQSSRAPAFEGSRVARFQRSKVPGFKRSRVSSSKVPGFRLQGSNLGSNVPGFQAFGRCRFQGFSVAGFQVARFQISKAPKFQGSMVSQFHIAGAVFELCSRTAPLSLL